VVVAGGSGPSEWVLLCYRLPREPSRPRIALWRRLKRLGAAQLGDGLVALPADARTREQLEWAAEEVLEAAGTASVWLARPDDAAQEREVAAGLAAARAAEYTAVADAAASVLLEGPAEQARTLRRLRQLYREITRRDFFPPAERERSTAALQTLAAAVAAASESTPAGRAR